MRFYCACVLLVVVSCTSSVIDKDSALTATPSPAGLRWSDPATWGDRVPAAGDIVKIPEDKIIVLDQSTPALGGLLIKGQLHISKQKDISITSNWIAVSGLMQAGTEVVPHPRQLTITLTGDKTVTSPLSASVGTKHLAVLSGGRLELHGQKALSWTQLGATATKGATSITLKESVNWQVGDRVVIASTGFEMLEAEERVLTKVDGTTVNFTDPLLHQHFGELQRYSNAQRSWTLDSRAEVGLLTRNILIQGDQASQKQGFGGHIIVSKGGIARLEHIEVTRMGQRAIAGRYPIHWHMARDDGKNSYLKNASLHHLYNRCVTIHSTNNLVIRNNVAYDTTGHCYFVEDGNEKGNVIENNLGLVTRRPAKEFALLPSDLDEERNMSGPATFWLTNPENTLRNNRAAGSDGSGIWLAPFQNPAGHHYDAGYEPRFAPMGIFTGNTAHSSYHGIVVCCGANPGDKTQTSNPNMDFRPPTVATFNNLTMYKNRLGLYSRVLKAGSVYNDVIIADNVEGETSTWTTAYNRFLWVGGSKNYEAKPNEPSPSRSEYVYGHALYDGPVDIHDSHFAGFDKSSEMRMMEVWPATFRFTGHSVTNTTSDMPAPTIGSKPGFKNYAFSFGYVLNDIDGKLSGFPGQALVSQHSVMMTDTCTKLPAPSDGYSCPEGYAYIELKTSDESITGSQKTRRQPATFTRSDGQVFHDDGIHLTGYAMVPLMTKDFSYKVGFQNFIPASTEIVEASFNEGESVILEFPNTPQSTKVYASSANKKYVALRSFAGLVGLKAFKGAAYYWSAGTLYVKTYGDVGTKRTDGLDDAVTPAVAQDSIFVCLYANCAKGDNLPITK
jgi:G8 domain